MCVLRGRNRTGAHRIAFCSLAEAIQLVPSANPPAAYYSALSVKSRLALSRLIPRRHLRSCRSRVCVERII